MIAYVYILCAQAFDVFCDFCSWLAFGRMTYLRFVISGETMEKLSSLPLEGLSPLPGALPMFGAVPAW